MRQLQIVGNDTILDIDRETAVGISYKGFSFNDAGNIHLSFSNDFSIPLTKKNRAVFGFPDNMSLNSVAHNDNFYDKIDVKIYTDGQFLFSGKCYVDSVEKDRMRIFVVSNKNLIEKISELSMSDVTDTVVSKINTAIGTAFPTGADWTQFVNYTSTAANSIWLPYAITSMYKQFPEAKTDDGVTSVANKYDDDGSTVENESNFCTEFITSSDIVGSYKSGHFFIKVKDVLDWMLDSLGFTANYDATLSSELEKDFVRFPDIVSVKDGSGHFTIANNKTYKVKIDDKEVESKFAKVKAIDFFKTIMQEYGIVFDIDNSNNVYFKCFQNIKSETLKKIKSGKVTNRKFSLDGISQTCWIGYSSLKGEEDEASTTGGLQLICKNKNIEVGDENTIAFSIKRMLVGYFTYGYGSPMTNSYALDLTDEKSMEEFIIARKSDDTSGFNVAVNRYENSSITSTTSVMLYQAVQSSVSTNGAYALFKANVEYPEEIQIDVFLKTYEVFNFSPSNYVEFDGIPGFWYVEEISNFNPRLDAQIVNIKAMRIR